MALWWQVVNNIRTENYKEVIELTKYIRQASLFFA
jgi:hypothetical protein